MNSKYQIGDVLMYIGGTFREEFISLKIKDIKYDEELDKDNIYIFFEEKTSLSFWWESNVDKHFVRRDE